MIELTAGQRKMKKYAGGDETGILNASNEVERSLRQLRILRFRPIFLRLVQRSEALTRAGEAGKSFCCCGRR